MLSSSYDHPANYLYLIALGSNLGERLQLIQAAIMAIETELGQVRARALLYETMPIGAADQLFLNTALVCHSTYAPEIMLSHLLAIELKLGRQRHPDMTRWSNRPIDLDILLALQISASCDRTTYNPIIYQSETLKLPHPHLLERDFVLVPACDIAADWLYPHSGLTLRAERQSRSYHLSPWSADNCKPASLA